LAHVLEFWSFSSASSTHCQSLISFIKAPHSFDSVFVIHYTSIILSRFFFTIMELKTLAVVAFFLQANCWGAQASNLSRSTQSDKPCNQNSTVKTPADEFVQPTVSASGSFSGPKPTLPAALPPTKINTTATYRPIEAPGFDCSNPNNLIPSSNVSVYYGSPSIDTRVSENATVDVGTGSGLINMTLAMNGSTIVLEYIDSILSVDCTDDSLTVTFNGAEAYDAALSAWTVVDTLFMVTNHQGACDTEFERGFYMVEEISSDATSHSITGHASAKDVAEIAGKFYPPICIF
jgi:hypothetical protein